MALHFNPDRKYSIKRNEIDSLSVKRKVDPSYIEYHDGVKSDITSRLSKIIHPVSGIIDGSVLKSLIFPTEGMNYDVFISHSHNDLDQAKKLAKYLYEECGRHPFLDDDIWHSADGLLRKLDDAYCQNEGKKSYNYHKRNFSTSHVHTMLSMAMLEMIVQCESFIFIESKESLDFNRLKETGEKTQSPWIYQELQFAKILSNVNKPLFEQRQFNAGGRLRISYEVDTTEFKRLYWWNIDAEFSKFLKD